MLRLRSSLLGLFVGLLLTGLVAPVSAQSVASVVENMKKVHEKQLETVDTYIVDTNLYTSYNKKISKGGSPAYQTSTQMKGSGGANIGEVGRPSAAHDMKFEKIQAHATYEGAETVNGVRCHVLRVENASKVTDASQNAQKITYYIDANRHLPTRMTMVSDGEGRGPGSKTRTVTVNMTNYQTTDGLTLPHRMEIQFNMDMSEQQRKKMKMMMQKMENMPEQQREQMKQMMGEGQMEMMKKMMSGEPIVAEVQSVKVNVDLPEGVF